MNVVDHQLQIVAMDIIIQATENRRDAVITLLPGIEVLPPDGQLKLLRDQVVGSRHIESGCGELGKGRRRTRNRARLNSLLKKFTDQIKLSQSQPAIHAPSGPLIRFRQDER